MPCDGTSFFSLGWQSAGLGLRGGIATVAGHGRASKKCPAAPQGSARAGRLKGDGDGMSSRGLVEKAAGGCRESVRGSPGGVLCPHPSARLALLRVADACRGHRAGRVRQARHRHPRLPWRGCVLNLGLAHYLYGGGGPDAQPAEYRVRRAGAACGAGGCEPGSPRSVARGLRHER